MLLGQPEEIALCALSTLLKYSAASLHPGTYTLSTALCIFIAELFLL